MKIPAVPLEPWKTGDTLTGYRLTGTVVQAIGRTLIIETPNKVVISGTQKALEKLGWKR